MYVTSLDRRHKALDRRHSHRSSTQNRKHRSSTSESIERTKGAESYLLSHRFSGFHDHPSKEICRSFENRIDHTQNAWTTWQKSFSTPELFVWLTERRTLGSPHSRSQRPPFLLVTWSWNGGLWSQPLQDVKTFLTFGRTCEYALNTSAHSQMWCKSILTVNRRLSYILFLCRNEIIYVILTRASYKKYKLQYKFYVLPSTIHRWN